MNYLEWALKGLACTGIALNAPFAHAEGSFSIDAVYTADVSATASGGRDHRARYLDNLDIIADADLDRLVGWQGAHAHVHVLNNMGAITNDGAGTLQGIDNIEVNSHRLRLFEAWIEQSFGSTDAGTSIRAGLYDVNSEFYANESAGLLIAPPFGIGSEMAATGPNGPSIFPSTALAVRVRTSLGGTGYVQGAIVNAQAGTLGDPGGVNTSFNTGALVIGEIGWGGSVHVAVGGWRYTKRQEDIFATDGSGNPLQRRAQGGYALVEWNVTKGENKPTVTLFTRAGFSDGKTSLFKGGIQAGMLIGEPITGRPDSAISLGVHRGWLSNGFRLAQQSSGIIPSKHETALELTYSDRLMRHVSIQPDVQYIIHPGGDASTRDAIVTTLRMTFDFWNPVRAASAVHV